MTLGTALVRPPSTRLAEGAVEYIERVPVDVARARRQHAAYCAALTSAGWTLREVAPAEDCPDSVFIEDTVVVCEGLAVLTLPGAPHRRAEVPGTEAAVRAADLEVAAIVPPATLDGGDVLQVGRTVYVGLGTRTNADGAAQLARLLASRGRTVVPVPLHGVLHLKSVVTALPDGTVLAARGAAAPPALPPPPAAPVMPATPAAIPGSPLIPATAPTPAAAPPGSRLTPATAPTPAAAPPGSPTIAPDSTASAARGPGLDLAVFPIVQAVAEESGAHVVPLGGDRVLIAASAPETAALLRRLGLTPIVVDISEFEKLEGCVTCLSVLIPAAYSLPCQDCYEIHET